MSNNLSWIVFGLMTVGLLGVGAVAAHAPELHKDDGAVERLHVIAVDKEATPHSEPATRYDMNMALSDNASATSDESRNFTFEQDYLDYPVCLVDCGPSYYEDDLQNVGEDFELRGTESISGNLHFTHEYDHNGLSPPSKSSTIGLIDVGLAIGEDVYEAQRIPLGPEGGEFNVTLLFHWVPACQEDENGTEVCQEAPATQDVWSHDAILSVQVRPYSSYSLTSVPWYESLTVSFDTAGGSFIDLAVPEVLDNALVTVSDNAIVSIQHNELDADGAAAEPVFYAEEGEEGTTYYAAGPAMPLVMVAALGLAFAVRRRFG